MPASTVIDQTADKVDSNLGDAEKRLNDLVERAQKTVQEGLDTLRSQTRVYADQAKVYADQAGDQLEVAQKLLTEKVQERPLASTAIALGVGVLIGLLLAGGRR
jgi:ElaB/YqjD/DUF883 family membrane-anchored ribosome-binding protein